MDATVRGPGVLVVGCGFLGAQRASLLAMRGRLAGVVDVDEARAWGLGRRLKARSGSDYAEGLNWPGVASVVVATPHADHAEQVRQALDAGKSVLCEKPLALDPADAHELAGLAEQRGLRLATGLNHRFFPPILDALELARDGALGPIQSVRAVIGHRARPSFLAGWHGDPARSGGGTLVDNGPHACDLIRLLIGEVTSAWGSLRGHPDLPHGCEIEAFATFRGLDGAIAELRSSWELESGYLTLEIRGRDGHLRAETAPWRLTGRLAQGLRLSRNYLAERIREKFFRKLHGGERSLAHELDVFLSGPRDPEAVIQPATGWEGVRTVEMVHAISLSALTGREVAVAPPVARTPHGASRGLRIEAFEVEG